MTNAIAATARAAAAAGTEIVGLTPSLGADSVDGNFESYLAAVAVMDAVVRYQGDFDAVVQAGFGEHGREGLHELLDVPVVDITDAAGHLASLLGHKFPSLPPSTALGSHRGPPHAGRIVVSVRFGAFERALRPPTRIEPRACRQGDRQRGGVGCA